MTALTLCLSALCAALVSTYAIVPAAPAAAQTCEGDCNGDGSVAIDEIILGVRIAFGDAPIADCRAIDGDGNGAVTVNELVAAVSRALQGCGGGPVPPTSTPTRTNTPVPTTSDEAALAASARVATEPIFRLFDFQAGIGASAGVAGPPRAGMGRPAGASGCQQFDCRAFGTLTGTEEDCCSGTQFSRLFSNCVFDDDLGRVVSLNGLFDLISDTADVCTGAIPVGASFAASLSSFTHDVRSPDGSFSRTFQDLSETFDAAPGGCTMNQPGPFGFGIRGDGRRLINGERQQFQSDGFGNILVDSESDVAGLAIAESSTQEADGCTVPAALSGSMTNADFRVGTEFNTDFTEFHVVQHPQADALVLGLNGTVGTDCLGDVTLSTVEPLRIASGDPCFTAGRLEAGLGDGTASVTYTESAGVDVHLGADSSVDQHFATCTDVPRWKFSSQPG